MGMHFMAPPLDEDGEGQVQFLGIPVAALAPKDLRILEQCIDGDEPLIIFRAQDILAIFILKEYERLVELFQGNNPTMGQEIAERITEFQTWQRSHPHRVKLPD